MPTPDWPLTTERMTITDDPVPIADLLPGLDLAPAERYDVPRTSPRTEELATPLEQPPGCVSGQTE